MALVAWSPSRSAASFEVRNHASALTELFAETMPQIHGASGTSREAPNMPSRPGIALSDCGSRMTACSGTNLSREHVRFSTLTDWESEAELSHDEWARNVSNAARREGSCISSNEVERQTRSIR